MRVFSRYFIYLIMNIIKSNCFPLYYIFFFKLLQRCCQQRSDRQNYSRISFNNCSIINKKPDETGVSSLKLLIVKNSLYQFVSRNCRNYWSLAGNIWKLKSFRESPSFTLARYFWEQSRVDFSPRSTLAKKEVRYVEASKVRSSTGPEERDLVRRKIHRIWKTCISWNGRKF